MKNGHLDSVKKELEFLVVLQGRTQCLHIENPLF